MVSLFLVSANLVAVLVIAGVGGVLLVLFGIAFKDVIAMLTTGRRHERLRQAGVPAPALIQRVWLTGAEMNRTTPEVGLSLRVLPQGEQPFEAETTAFISNLRIPQFQPGAVIRVRYDPENPQSVAVE